MTGEALGEETVIALLLLFLLWGRSPLLVVWLGKPGNRCKVPRILKIPKPLGSLHPKVPILSALLVPSGLCFPKPCQIKAFLGDTPLSKQTGKPCFLEIVLHLYIFFPVFFFLSSSFSFSFQVKPVRNPLLVLPLLQNQKAQKVSASCSYCVSFSFISFPSPFSFSSFLWRSPLHLFLPLATLPLVLHLVEV